MSEFHIVFMAPMLAFLVLVFLKFEALKVLTKNIIGP